MSLHCGFVTKCAAPESFADAALQRTRAEQAHAASRYRTVMTVSDAIMPMGMSLAGFLTCAHMRHSNVRLLHGRWTAIARQWSDCTRSHN